MLLQNPEESRLGQRRRRLCKVLNTTLSYTLLAGFLLFFADQVNQQEEAFKNCRYPLDTWLYASFVSFFLLRMLIGLLTSSFAWLTINMQRLLLFIAFVAMFIWTIMGIKWYHESSDNPECVTKEVDWLMTFWLVLFYTLNIILLLVMISKGTQWIEEQEQMQQRLYYEDGTARLR